MGWLVEEAQSSADATAQVSSTSPLSAKRPKLAPPATDDSSVMNALGPLLNAGTSHSQLIGGMKMNRAFLAPCVAVTAMF